MILYFLITLILYAIYASVPFWGVSESKFIFIMPVFSLFGGITWALIASKTPKAELTYNGLIFDALITISFFVVPAMLTKQDFTIIKVLGMILVILGIILIKK